MGNGAVFNTPNAGTFGGLGFLGNGNIALGGSSFDRDPGLANTGYLNINFNASQNVSTLTPLATLLVNTTGLADGNYSITSTSGFFGLNKIADASGSFSIVTAVPEPSSMLLLSSLGIMVSGWYRVRRKNESRIEKL